MKSILIYITIGMVFILSCGKPAPNEQAETAGVNESTIVLTTGQIANTDTSTVVLTERNMNRQIRVNGSVELAVNGRASVSTPVSCMLTQITVAKNEYVGKGDVIARFSDQSIIDWQGEYLLSESELARLEKEWRRQEGLKSKDATSEKNVELIRGEYDRMKYKVETLSKKLRYLGLNPSEVLRAGIVSEVELRAPISGQISWIGATPGQYMSQSDRILEIVESEGAYVLLHVYESDLPSLEKDQEVELEASRKWQGRIESIGSVLKEDRTVDVVVHIVGDRSGLVGGMYVKALVHTRNTPTWALSSESIVEYEGAHYIIVKKGDMEFEMEKVETGLESDGFTEIVMLDYTLLRSKRMASKAYALLMALKNREE